MVLPLTSKVYQLYIAMVGQIILFTLVIGIYTLGSWVYKAFLLWIAF